MCRPALGALASLLLFLSVVACYAPPTRNSNLVQSRRSISRRPFISPTTTTLCMYADEPNPTGPGSPPRLTANSDNDKHDDAFPHEKRVFLDEFGHPIEEKRIDYAGAGTLGDIMSSDEGILSATAGTRSTGVSESDTTMPNADGVVVSTSTYASASYGSDEGLVTTAGGTLQARFGNKIPNMSPLERIALTSNGNLQRIFSSYYDAPVHVHVDRFEMRNDDDASSTRNGSTNGSTMIGNDIDLMMTSVTINTNRQKNNGESNTEKETGSTNDGNSNKATNTSANGAVWDRKVHLSVHSKRFCTARSIVTVSSPDCIRLVRSGAVGIGQLFRYLDRLPTFALLDAGRTEDGGMWRSYTLECDELSCVIREEFTSDAWSIVPPPS